MNISNLFNVRWISWGLCLVMFRMYREDSYSLSLYLALSLPVLLTAAHLVFSVFESTKDEFVKTSIEFLWMMGFLVVLATAAVYFDADFVNRGVRYDANAFYPLVQASALQGMATLICLVIRRFFPSGQAAR
jgi:hypothetical protein